MKGYFNEIPATIDIKNNNKRLRGGLEDSKGYNLSIKLKNKVDFIWEDFNSEP